MRDGRLAGRAAMFPTFWIDAADRPADMDSRVGRICQYQPERLRRSNVVKACFRRAGHARRAMRDQLSVPAAVRRRGRSDRGERQQDRAQPEPPQSDRVAEFVESNHRTEWLYRLAQDAASERRRPEVALLA